MTDLAWLYEYQCLVNSQGVKDPSLYVQESVLVQWGTQSIYTIKNICRVSYINTEKKCLVNCISKSTKDDAMLVAHIAVTAGHCILIKWAEAVAQLAETAYNGKNNKHSYKLIDPMTSWTALQHSGTCLQYYVHYLKNG